MWVLVPLHCIWISCYMPGLTDGLPPKLHSLWRWNEYSVIFRLIYSSNSLTLWQPSSSIIRCSRQVLERANILHKLNTYFQLHGFYFQKQWVILSILVFQGSKSDICKGSDFLIFSVLEDPTSSKCLNTFFHPLPLRNSIKQVTLNVRSYLCTQ